MADDEYRRRTRCAFAAYRRRRCPFRALLRAARAARSAPAPPAKTPAADDACFAWR